MHRHTLLIADCSPEIHTLFDVILQSSKLDITHALNGQAAMEALTVQHPNLVILEPQMSSAFGVDGFGVLMYLAQSAATAHIPIIIASTAPYKTCHDYSWPAQVVDVVDKFRLNIAQFRDLVQAHLETFAATTTSAK
ncbi:MAG: response regulator [Anaerolineae bacterium]|nr:response regulator [Anaerolineae bacterium]